ncbi:hypothetical protein G3T11_13520 [Paenibacillus elgii]|nr:hypothetical protein [Paenibacillus elgii]
MNNLHLYRASGRNESIAITEISTPYVREALTRQLNEHIHSHAALNMSIQ